MKRDTALTNDIRVFFETFPDDNLSCANLFGSAARGELRPDSDIDIAMLFNVTPPSTLASKREDIIGRRVDLVVLNRSIPDLIHCVLRIIAICFIFFHY